MPFQLVRLMPGLNYLPDTEVRYLPRTSLFTFHWTKAKYHHILYYIYMTLYTCSLIPRSHLQGGKGSIEGDFLSPGTKGISIILTLCRWALVQSHAWSHGTYTCYIIMCISYSISLPNQIQRLLSYHMYANAALDQSFACSCQPMYRTCNENWRFSPSSLDPSPSLKVVCGWDYCTY